MNPLDVAWSVLLKAVDDYWYSEPRNINVGDRAYLSGRPHTVTWRGDKLGLGMAPESGGDTRYLHDWDIQTEEEHAHEELQRRMGNLDRPYWQQRKMGNLNLDRPYWEQRGAEEVGEEEGWHDNIAAIREAFNREYGQQ